MNLGTLCTALLGLICLSAGSVLANDYPTVDRVLYVEACIRNHPERNRQEMIYKCSCALDALAEQIGYDDFVELSTAFYAGQAAGERGTAVRESGPGQDMASRFRKAQADAFQHCLITD
jgi:hypothetical protein